MKKPLSVLTIALALAMAAPLSAGAQDDSSFARGVAAYEDGDYQAAAELWAPLAENGVPEAQRNLAQLYRLGLGVERDNERAYQLYVAAAEQNSVEAQVNVAFLLLTGEGVERDSKEAALWFAKAADQGDALAQFNLGLMYEKGVGVPQDRDTARELYQLAANQGQERALARLDSIEGDLPPDGGEAARREREESRRAEEEQAATAERERVRQEADVQRARNRANADADAEAEEERSEMEQAEAESRTGPIMMMEVAGEDEPAEPAARAPAEDREQADPAAVAAVANAAAAFGDAPLTAPLSPRKPVNLASTPLTSGATLVPSAPPQTAQAQLRPMAPARPMAPIRQMATPQTERMRQMTDAETAYRRGDFTTSIRLLIPLAQGGVPSAQFLLGRMFNRGEGVEIDHFQAYSLWRSAADRGNDRAATALANFAARYNPADLAQAERFYQNSRRAAPAQRN